MQILEENTGKVPFIDGAPKPGLVQLLGDLPRQQPERAASTFWRSFVLKEVPWR